MWFQCVWCVPVKSGQSSRQVCSSYTGSAVVLVCSFCQTLVPEQHWGVWSDEGESSLRDDTAWRALLLERKKEKNGWIEKIVKREYTHRCTYTHTHKHIHPPIHTEVLPVARKRCVASSSWGDIFTFISFSVRLKMEKSCCFLSWWDTRLLVLLSTREQLSN